MERTSKAVIIVVLVALAGPLLLYIGSNATDFLDIAIADNPLFNARLAYQLLTLPLAGFFIGLTFILRGSKASAFLGMGKINAPFEDEKYVGIKGKKGEGWANLGTQLGGIITLVTAIVIYFQVIRPAEGFNFSIEVLGMAVILSLSNAFVEEVIYRYSVVSMLDGLLAPRWIAVISGLLFGTVHYFGQPGGILGVLMAGFIGWFLAKSMLETRGFFWAYIIHFAQDVIIFVALLG